MPLYRHPSLTVLRVRPQAAAFLRQYTTHLIEAPRAAFLTREGRLVAAVRQCKISDDEALLVLDGACAERLSAHLSRYLALADTKIEPAGEYAVYFDSAASAPGAGERVIPEKAGQFLLSEDRNKTAAWTEADYTRFRVEHGIAEQGVDFNDEMPLCIDPSWIHFDKGCYLGQEIVARVHYRGAPPKRLTVKKESECSPEERLRLTSKTDTAGGVAGFLFV
jgi:folate-binding protein YgfZ